MADPVEEARQEALHPPIGQVKIKKEFLVLFFFQREHGGAMRAEIKCGAAGWPGDLPGWVADGATPVRRVLLKLKRGHTVQTNDIQTARILRSIDHILIRKIPSYHCKMRLVDVMELQELENFQRKSVPKNEPPKALPPLLRGDDWR